MAIDYGTKAVGVAISDELQLAVRPLTTIRRERKRYSQVLDLIRSLVETHAVGTLVVGMPFNMDGTRGEAAAKVERFVADLQNRLPIPIVTVDERLTSIEADQVLRERKVGTHERRMLSDQYAAAIMLQDYLDQQSRQSKTGSPPILTPIN
ncbi:MAG TPA: Holliday junction resolvase RuvX [Blastocatellia bacterium]|nr:Holliday junction resolvase RuvX [Blastocatellia bacterium]